MKIHVYTYVLQLIHLIKKIIMVKLGDWKCDESPKFKIPSQFAMM